MEGPSIRTLFQKAPEVFTEIKEHLKQLPKIIEVEGHIVIPVDDKEIKQACKDHGEMTVLLDSIFSKLLTKRGCVSDEMLESLAGELRTAMKKWIHMGLSLTPKFHILLAHALRQLKRLRGFSDMLEDTIERSHQYRVKDEARLARTRNQAIIKTAQAR